MSRPDIEIADPAVPPLALRVIIGPGGWQLVPYEPPDAALRPGEDGVYSICLDADERLLPAECQAVAAAGQLPPARPARHARQAA